MRIVKSVRKQVVIEIRIPVSETDKDTIETVLVLFYVVVQSHAAIRGVHLVMQLSGVANLVTNSPTQLNNREKGVF